MALRMSVNRFRTFVSHYPMQQRICKINQSTDSKSTKQLDIWQNPLVQQYYIAYEDFAGLTEVKSAQQKVLDVSFSSLI